MLKPVASLWYLSLYITFFMSFAPIIIFAFNRPESLKQLISSLLLNTECIDCDLYIFVDGARANKEGEVLLVKLVQEYVKTIVGFKSINYFFSETNKGLGPSIIAGVSEVINKHGKAIVLEDDLMLTSNFLAFMNQGLEKYENEQKVFSICGYSNKVNRPCDYIPDSYFCTRSSSWGWATWADRWNSVDWNLEPFDQYVIHKKAFNKWGGSDCFGMLNGWHDGKNKSWAIRFCFSQFLQDKLSLFPIESKVINDGFDGQGTNCKSWSRFKYEVDNSGSKEFSWPVNISLNKKIYSEAMWYNSILIRVWSRIMYLLY